MAIRQTKYVDITSGVGGKSAVSDRELIARVFTTNSLCGIGHVYEFNDLDSVMNFFGSGSDEYKFAAKYFGFVSKNVSKAKKISFFRWAPTASNAYITALEGANTTLSYYTDTNGKIAIVNGDVTDEITVSISSAASIAGVCGTVQSAIRAYQRAGAVTYPFFNSRVIKTSNNGFDIQKDGLSATSTQASALQVYLRAFSGYASANVTASTTTGVYHITGVETPTTVSGLISYLNDYTESSATSTPYANATVSVTSGKVTLDFGGSFVAEAKPLLVMPTTSAQRDLATLLGLTNAICSNRTAVETPVEAASRSDALSDNYGSFMFVGGTELSVAENKAVAEWNAAKNYKYLFCIGILGYTNATGSLANQPAITSLVASGTGVGGIVGTCVWCYKNASDYITAFPAALLATTDYSRSNSTKTFMYQQNETIEAAITSDASANILDPLYVNYMGVTQSAGGLIKFSQDGFNMDGVDTAVYCNEVWMKASFWTSIMNLFLAVEKVPANDEGAGMIKTVMMDTITTAIKNGTIQAHKDFTITQKVYIGTILANNEAWKDVWSNGYVLNISIANENNKYVAKYILVYSKGDAIRKVEGSDILI